MDPDLYRRCSMFGSEHLGMDMPVVDSSSARLAAGKKGRDKVT